MSQLVLIAFLLVAVLALVGAAAGAVVPALRPAAMRLAAPLAVAALVLCVPALAAHGTASLPLPLGPPGAGISLRIDAAASAFLPLLVWPVAIAANAPGRDGTARADPADAPALLVLLAAALLVPLAGDGFLLVLAAATLCLMPGRPRRRALLLAVALAAALAPLVAADGILAGDNFARAPLEIAGRGATFAVAPLALVACACLAWPDPPAARDRTGPGLRAAIRATCPAAAVFLLVRVVLDLASGPLPAGAGLWVLAAGLGSALAGAVAALRGDTVEAVLERCDLVATGLAASAVGLALVARAADLPPMGATCLGAAMLLLAARAGAVPLATLAAAALARQAGGRRLDLLGGLVGAMPQGVAALGLAAATAALLPPLAGFAGAWLLLGGLLGAEADGAPLLPALCALATAAAGLAIGLALAAAFRMFAAACLGRPRTPRAAAATEIGAAERRRLAVAAAPVLLLALLPGPFLRAVGGLSRGLAGADLSDRAGWLAIRAWPGGAAWSAPAAALLVAGIAAAAIALARRPGAPEPREVAPWSDGAAPPPEWLPFGDPLAQALPATLAAPLPFGATGSARPLRRRWRRLARDARPAATLLRALLADPGPALLVGLCLAALAAAAVATGPSP